MADVGSTRRAFTAEQVAKGAEEIERRLSAAASPLTLREDVAMLAAMVGCLARTVERMSAHVDSLESRASYRGMPRYR